MKVYSTLMYITGLKSWIYYTEELKLYLTRSGKLFGTVELDKEIESFLSKEACMCSISDCNI